MAAAISGHAGNTLLTRGKVLPKETIKPNKQNSGNASENCKKQT